MAFAGGIEHMAYGGWSFGLGFLNFLGTVLFFVFLVAGVRALARFRGWRPRPIGPDGRDSGGSGGEPDGRGWAWVPVWGPARGSWRGSRTERERGTTAPAAVPAADEAMAVARQRLADGEIEPDAFAAIRSGLEQHRPTDAGHDAAVARLRLRFARGELDRERFEAALHALR